MKLLPAFTETVDTTQLRPNELKLYVIDTGLPGAPSFNARAGDTVQFYDIQTVVAKREGTVESVIAVVDPAVVSEAAKAMSDVNAQCAGGCGIFNCSGICGFHYNLNRVFEVVVAFPTWSTPGHDQQELQPFDLVQVKGRSANGADSAAICLAEHSILSYSGTTIVPRSSALHGINITTPRTLNTEVGSGA
eukprot:COSAG02_NODE_4139_length_5725_cov_5.233914_4_plen_191_part_00